MKTAEVKKQKCRYKGCITLKESTNKLACCHVHQGRWARELRDKIDGKVRKVEYYKLLIREAKKLELNKTRLATLKTQIRVFKHRLLKGHGSLELCIDVP